VLISHIKRFYFYFKHNLLKTVIFQVKHIQAHSSSQDGVFSRRKYRVVHKKARFSI